MRHQKTFVRAGRQLLGAQHIDGLAYRSNQTLFWSTDDAMHARAARYLERGFNELKLRVGTREEMRALTDVLLEREHVLVMADDIYEHMRYGGPF
ncbi:hypothetical protein CR51_41860 [Caballeronia megalochromosomata]|nr:hypothetical protein CR51_41860 [Caballeronia megalochromosomata]